MDLRDLLFGKKEEDMIELPVEEEQTQKIQVRIENIGGMLDVDRLTKLLREGNILLLKTKDLQ
jgi:SepF-like predicted cell division protein (DUF552 family)